VALAHCVSLSVTLWLRQTRNDARQTERGQRNGRDSEAGGRDAEEVEDVVGDWEVEMEEEGKDGNEESETEEEELLHVQRVPVIFCSC